MFKLVKKILLALMVVIIALVVIKARGRPTQVVPYPYIIKINDLKPPEGTEQADVLILGDTMGLSFGPYQEILVNTASQGLAADLKVVNWSWTNEGLHRSLAKLKSLASLPKVVLYFGGSDELRERPFIPQAGKEILRNFELYANPRIATAVTLLPVTSRLIYQSHPMKEISEFVAAELEKDPQAHQRNLEIHYKIFELELKDFVTHTRSLGSIPLLMTYPINLQTTPRQVCNNTQTTQVVSQLEQKAAQLKQRRFKEAYADLSELAPGLVANADAWYMLGIAAQSMGLREEALQALTKAKMFDCDALTSGPVFNAIMRKVSQETGVFLIDFDKMMEGQYGRNELFLSDRFPQTLYYQALARDTAKVIRQVFDLK